MEVDTVLVAIGNSSNPLISQTTHDGDVNKWDNIKVDENQKSSINIFYAGVDIVLSAATGILAMGEGRRAAKTINEQLADELASVSNQKEYSNNYTDLNAGVSNLKKSMS